MKTNRKPATSKLVARFDDELRNLLMGDLRAFREKMQLTSNNQARKQTLSVA